MKQQGRSPMNYENNNSALVAASGDTFAAGNEIAFETLGTEKLRIMVLLAIMSAAALFSLIPPTYFSPEMANAFRGNLTPFIKWRFVVLGGLVLYLLAERLLLSFLIKRNRTLPGIYHYVTALIETSCPTAAIMVAAIYTEPSSAIATIPVFIYPVFIVLSALRLNFRLSLFTGFVAAMEYLWVAKTFFIDQQSSYAPIHVSKAVALFMLGVVTGLVALEIKKRIIDSYKTTEERNRIVSMFGEHVSPAVVDALLSHAELRSEKKDVCVMFLDIRDFTGFAEKKSPEEVVKYLERLFEFMIEIVNRNNGIINKFLGDGFMAVFGAPVSTGRDCLNAVTAAREILGRLKTDVESGLLPSTTIGIGLHAGEAVTGNIGSALRKEYTVIGDVVNLASRIEKLNKEFGSRILVSEIVWKAAFSEHLRDVTPKGRVQVRGRQEPIQVYQLA
jgi:adenylate cyclase